MSQVGQSYPQILSIGLGVLSTGYPQAFSQSFEWFLIETCKIVTATNGVALSMLNVLPQSQTCLISVLIRLTPKPHQLA